MLLLPDFYAFYGVFACPVFASSYLIDSDSGGSTSAWPRVDLGLGLRFLGLLAGGSPAASNFLLLRQKKVTKEKATRLSGSLRFASGNLRCPQKTGVGANSLHCVSLKQRAALIPFFGGNAGPDRTGGVRNRVRVSAPSPVGGRLGWGLCELEAGLQRRWSKRFAGVPIGSRSTTVGPHPNLPPTGEGVRKEKSATATVPVPVLASASASASAPTSPVLAGPVMSGKSGIRAARCLSRRRVCAAPRFCRSSQVARSAAKGPGQPGRLFFGDFLLAKQKKVTCRRATPGQQNHAEKAQAKIKSRPAQRWQATGTKP